jgi:hypothetical protein
VYAELLYFSDPHLFTGSGTRSRSYGIVLILTQMLYTDRIRKTFVLLPIKLPEIFKINSQHFQNKFVFIYIPVYSLHKKMATVRFITLLVQMYGLLEIYFLVVCLTTPLQYRDYF